MNRLKFLLFAAVALVLWGYWLTTLAGGISARAIETASSSAQAAPRAVALKLEAIRTGLLTAALKAGASPAGRQKAGKPEAPPADRVVAARTAALEALGEAVKGKLIVGAFNEQGALVAVGEGEPSAPPAGMEARQAAEAGASGAILTLDNVPHLFFSAPVVGIDKGEAIAAGHLFVGLPLTLDAAALDGIARDLNLVAVGLAAGGNMVAVGGLDKKALEGLLKSAKLGEVALLNQGSVSELGPLKFPMGTAGDALGGKAALAVGFRRDIAGTPFEVLTISSTRPLMAALGDLQKFSVFALLGLLVLAVGVAFLLNEQVEDEAPAVVAPQLVTRPATNPPLSSAAASADGMSKEPASNPVLAAAANAPLPIPEGPLGREASPDDFQFSSESSPNNPMSAPPVADFGAPGVAEPMGFGGETDANPQPQVQPTPLGGATPDPFAELNAQSPFDAAPDYSQDESQRTVAYPVMSPYAAAGASNPSANYDPNFNPDTTRVATVPKELLQASQRISQEVTAVNPRMMAAAMPKVSPMLGGAGPGGDEAHWQDVFQQFVAMREKCGEPADGLTYEKFSAKLRKNKEQLVAKYNCRTVRFQVHAKDGKAALKATPVRD